MGAYNQDTPFRSADMSLVQLYVANEIGRDVVSALGEVGEMQFRDLNQETSAFQKTFTQEIRRLDNIHRQLLLFKENMEKEGIKPDALPSSPESLNASSPGEIDELGERCQGLETRVAQLNDSYEILKRREVELTEWRYVLREAGGFFDRAYSSSAEIRPSMESSDAPLIDDMEQSRGNGHTDEGSSFAFMNIGFVSGVIPRERIAAFERILWRSLRGNLYMNQSEIEEPLVNPSNNEKVSKSVFVIFAHGKEIIAKIRKIAESLGADLYSVDDQTDLRREQLVEVNNRLSDVAEVLGNTKRALDSELTQVARSIAMWSIIIMKEKATYETMNRFSYDSGRKTLIAEAWVPTNSLPLVQATLQEVTDRAGLSVPTIINELRTNKTPPTFVRTNKFTEGFQTIINAYGTSKYQEVNPGLPTIVTFPFLFAVMFGDLGHGALMFLAACAMIYWEKPLAKRQNDELFAMAFYGRYIAFMMGLFSMYTGLMYNDIFSKALTLFDSQWKWDWPSDFKPGDSITASKKPGVVYPFGIDYAWHGAENDLLFSNSYKMKLSIIMGWAHMTYSLMYSLVNARYFKTPIDIWGNFVPGMIFFQSIFGYLVFTILYKWSVDWVAIGVNPPGLLNMLIDMFLKPGTVAEPLFTGQGPLQVILVLLAVIQVPILLFLKPFYLRWENNKAQRMGYAGVGESHRVSALDDEDDEESHQNGSMHRDSMATENGGAVVTDNIEPSDEHEEFEFSEVMIHQVIHTIEFCLNCVSHTASYLRLWALSLAHQQLSIVLWDMTLSNVFAQTGVLGVFMQVVGFYLWFFLSVAILVVMEGTSAMLHSLRLHWVEAMSKHFMGDGIAFEPFSFKLMIEESEDKLD